VPTETLYGFVIAHRSKAPIVDGHQQSLTASVNAGGAVAPQNVVRRKMFAAMIVRVTKRTKLRPSRALPTARRARVERGNRLGPAKYAPLSMDCRRRS